MILSARLFVAVFLAGSCALIHIYSTQPLLADLAVQFGGSLTLGSWTITATTFAIALIAPFAGSISDRIGRKCVIVFSILGMTTATSLCAVAPSMTALIAFRFLQGLFIPFLFAVVVAYINEEWDYPESVRINAIYISGSVFGGFCGRFLSGIAASNFGWRSSFIVLSVFSLLALAVIIKWLPRERKFRPAASIGTSLRGMRNHFSNWPLLTTCLIGASIMFAQVASFTYAALYLAAPPFSLSLIELSSIFIVFLVGVVVTPMAGRAISSFGRGPTFIASCLLSWTGLAICLFPSTLAIVVGLACCSTGIFSGQACATSYAAMAARIAKSSGVGLYLTAYYFGGSLGSILPAPIFLKWGWAGFIALISVVLAIGFVAALLIWPIRGDRAARIQ